MRRSAWAIARMASNGSSLQFVACKFTHTDFLHCSFADCAFVKSEFDNTAAKASDFTNIRSDLKWWSDSEQCEVFVTFLNEAVGQFAAELGDNSTAVAALSKYRTDYVSGVITSKDYSVCLYNGEVPDKELDVVDRILDRLESQFPL
jgi:hypothetical protein